ncbi:MAG: Fe-S cluster assembly protein SufD [Myxococcota bacterium]|jgi:Fe-S cluster assembly protein SufD
MSAAVDSLARLRKNIGAERASSVPATEVATRLETMHAEGIAAFDEVGLPSRRQERWKGTNLSALGAMDFARIGTDTAAPSASFVDSLQDVDADLVFVDGRMVRASADRAALPEGTRVLSLLEASLEAPQLVAANLGCLADSKTDALVALNGALFEDVAVIELAPNAKPARALRIVSYSTSLTGAEGTASASFPRLLVVAGEGAEAAVLFENEVKGEAPGYTGLVAEFLLSANARVEFIESQSGPSKRIHVTQTFARVERDAHFDSHIFTLGEGLVRNELSVDLQGPAATTRMHGFFLGSGSAHHDHFTTVDHAAPHCSSDQEYRGVLGDKSAGVFRGRVIVRPGAQKTDARQSNPNILLSDGASIDTKPQLEIYADDIKASHGSTIGQLDTEALFFLRARGIGESDARLLMTRGFAQTIVDGVGDEATRVLMGERVDAALSSLQSSPSSMLPGSSPRRDSA